MDIATLEAQEADLSFPSFTPETALRLGQMLLTIAQSESLPVVIDIRTPNRTLFHAALPGATAMNTLWAQRKSSVTLRYDASSLLVGERMRAKGRDVTSDGLDPTDYATHGGSFPIRLSGGLVVAAATVSGLPQLDDHALVVRALREILA